MAYSPQLHRECLRWVACQVEREVLRGAALEEPRPHRRVERAASCRLLAVAGRRALGQAQAFGQGHWTGSGQALQALSQRPADCSIVTAPDVLEAVRRLASNGQRSGRGATGLGGLRDAVAPTLGLRVLFAALLLRGLPVEPRDPAVAPPLPNGALLLVLCFGPTVCAMRWDKLSLLVVLLAQTDQCLVHKIGRLTAGLD
mmetsp:Transcript_52600/g.163321  ORF Transcript_52600/g.163321 Transcript_52600/m.163321 type:complete len:200 (-) Transcript_52600:410-1009(-)